MEEKTKTHFAWNKVKMSIIELSLESDGPISEPSIRKQLHEIYGAADQGLINRQLHNLESIGCVESVSPGKKSRLNYWDIEFKNLKNIKNEFPNIQLSDYKKAKDRLIKGNFPDIHTRLYKKYYIYASLFPSLFDTLIKFELEPILKRVPGLWEINDYKEIISSLNDKIYENIFLNNLFNPPRPIIEISKDELKNILEEIQYPYIEDNDDKQTEIIRKSFSENLVNVVLSKRPNSNKDQVQKEVGEKIMDHTNYFYQEWINDVVDYQHLRRFKVYERLCKHFYETDFLIGKVEKDARTFIEKLEERIENNNIDEIKSAKELQERIDYIDSFYNEWYEKCLQNDKQRLTLRGMHLRVETHKQN